MGWWVRRGSEGGTPQELEGHKGRRGQRPGVHPKERACPALSAPRTDPGPRSSGSNFSGLWPAGRLNWGAAPLCTSPPPGSPQKMVWGKPSPPGDPLFSAGSLI